MTSQEISLGEVHPASDRVKSVEARRQRGEVQRSHAKARGTRNKQQQLSQDGHWSSTAAAKAAAHEFGIVTEAAPSTVRQLPLWKQVCNSDSHCQFPVFPRFLRSSQCKCTLGSPVRLCDRGASFFSGIAGKCQVCVLMSLSFFFRLRSPHSSLLSQLTVFISFARGESLPSLLAVFVAHD